MKHLVIGQRQKALNFSAFHGSAHGSLVSIGQYFVTTRVVHSPKRTETSLIIKSNQSGPNHQLLQICTARTAWSYSDQAMRAVHSCNSWLSSVVFSPGLACQAKCQSCHTKKSTLAKIFTEKRVKVRTVKITMYLDLDILIKLKFTTNFDRCARY